MTANTLLIGVDGGATEAKAHQVAIEHIESARTFQLGSATASHIYKRLKDFEPVPIATQLCERERGNIEVTQDEQRQGTEWIAAACRAIVDVSKAAPPAESVLVGVGMPGLKSPDGRGIVAINNGPRIPDFLDQLEAQLIQAGVTLSAPIAVLGSDADYCGMGEEYATTGLFRDVENAYYLGAGTGIADALKLRGKLVTFDAASNWIQKAWQIPSAFGPTFEKLISAKAMNETFHRLTTCGSNIATTFPEKEAAQGNPIAIAWMQTAALLTAELIFERLWTIKNGRLDRNHVYKGTILDRVIIGQRLGQICHQPHSEFDLLSDIASFLTVFVNESNDSEMAQAYAPTGSLKAGLLMASNLRAAPALGAAVAAIQALKA